LWGGGNSITKGPFTRRARYLGGGSIKKYFVAQQQSKGNPFLGMIAELRNRLLASSCLPLSVCLSAWNKSALTGRIFVKFNI